MLISQSSTSIFLKIYSYREEIKRYKVLLACIKIQSIYYSKKPVITKRILISTHGLFYRDSSNLIITQMMGMSWCNYLEVFLWSFHCMQLAVGLQHRLPTKRWCYCFLLMPYGVSMKLFKKLFPKCWRIFSPPNVVSSKRFLSLTKNRSFEHGGYAPLQN